MAHTAGLQEGGMLEAVLLRMLLLLLMAMEFPAAVLLMVG
jgi:hypothetical protein